MTASRNIRLIQEYIVSMLAKGSNVFKQSCVHNILYENSKGLNIMGKRTRRKMFLFAFDLYDKKETIQVH